MRVRDIMSPAPETVGPRTPVRDLAERLISHRVGGFPVVERGALVGMVTRSDLVRVIDLEGTIDAQLGEAVDAQLAGKPESSSGRGARIGARLEAMTVADLMIRGVVSIDAEASVRDAAKLLVERRVHRLPVVEGEKLVGIVTSLDVTRLVAEGRVD